MPNNSVHPLTHIIRRTILEAVLNDNFWRWFDGSKVVDADGNPQVVHHGTSKKFTRFNLKNAPQPIIWFTSNRSAIDAGEVGAAGRGHIMDLYASIKNPAGWKEYEKYGLGQLKGLGYDGAILPGEGGFDGFVFEPAQLKSVKNKGEWDPSNKNILKEDSEQSKPYKFYMLCDKLCRLDGVEVKNQMVADAVEISREEFVENCAYANELFEDEEWMLDDPTTAFYRSMVKGVPCMYMQYRGFEYIFVKGGPGGNEHWLNENVSDSLIVYHGTDNRFESFDASKPMFFVDDIDVAKTYGRFIIKAQLFMSNPIELDFGGNSTYHFFDKWYLPSDLANKIKEISDDIKNHYSLDDDLKDYLEDLNFSDSYGDLDGIIMKNISDSHDMFSSNKPATNYVVFDKNQIRVL